MDNSLDKISIYTSGFNLIKGGFKYWQNSLRNFSKFADEVVIAVNSSEDGTLEAIQDLKIPNLNIIQMNLSYEDPLLDGKLKNLALEHTQYPMKIQLDLDEYIPEKMFPHWKEFISYFSASPHSVCMIPSLNIFSDFDHSFSMTKKWYLHREGFFRGPVNYARKPDGTINTELSDGCELIDRDGNLLPAAILPDTIDLVKQYSTPFVVHYGYVDLDARLVRNKEFWAKHWLTESGGVPPKHKIHENLDDFCDFSPILHGLPVDSGIFIAS